MAASNLIHLRPSRHLINPNFDGYKLSLEPVPVLKTLLSVTPRRCYTSDDQYSFLHAKLFSQHNLLVKDPWQSHSFYFLDDSWTVQNIKYDTTSGRIQPIRAVFKLLRGNTSNGDYNPTFCFISEKYCVLSDGCGTLRLVDTGDRYRGEEWKGIFADQLLEPNVRFILQDARLEFRNANREVHCLLLSVQSNSEENDQKFEAVIDWVILQKAESGNTWSKVNSKQLRSASLPDYCALEPKCKSILLTTDRKWKFTSDSEQPIAEQQPDQPAENIKTAEIKNSINFTWTQTDEDVIIHFSIPRESNKGDVKVVCAGTKIQVLHICDSLLDAELYDRVDSDLTTWNLENEQLQVTLVKVNPDKVWKSLLSNIDIQPCEPSAQVIRDLSQPPTSSLRTEMEDCDYGDGDIESDFFLERIDACTHSATHRAFLGQSNAPLFRLPLRVGQPPAIAVRSDVDVCLWQPILSVGSLTDTNEINWQLQHEGTINAFGYVQASKQQKKYLQCSPDMSYAVICEPHRHVFIYKTAHTGATGLKNRTSGSKASIGQQKLIVMDEMDEVVGISVEDDVILLLTQKHVICLQINA